MNIFKIIFLTLLLFFFENGALCQEPILVITPKVGIYNFLAKEDGGFIYGGDISLIKNKNIYGIDYTRFDELVIFGPNPPEHYNQIGLMYGKYGGSKDFRFQYQGGLAPFWGTQRTDLDSVGNGFPWNSDFHKTVSFFTVGLSAKAGIKWVISPMAYLGLDLQGNLNQKHSNYIAFFSLAFGKRP